MLRTALRSLRAHALRFALSGFAVVLGVAFVTGALLYGESARAASAQAGEKSQPDVSAVVAAAPSSSTEEPPELGPGLRERLQRLPGVSRVRGVVEGRAFVVGRDGSLVGSLADSAGVNYQAGDDGSDTRYPLTSGRGPQAGGEVALDRRTAERAGYGTGDRIRVVVRGETRHVRLVGMFTAHDSRVAAGGTLTAFDPSTALRELGEGRGYTQLALTAAPGVSDDQVAARAAKVLPSGLEALTRDQALDTGSGDEDKMTSLLVSFASVVLLVSAFLVANTFTMLAAACAREHALLRVVGATRRYVQRMVLIQALLVGTVASVVGYGLGVGLGAVLKTLFPVLAAGSGQAGGAPLHLFSPTAAGAALAVGVGVTALAAWLPARRAARVSPMAAMRTGEPSAPASLRWRTVAGFGVTLTGALGAVSAAGSGDLGIVTGAGAVLLVGLMLLAPWCAVVLAGLLRAPLRRLAGVRGTLAVENARRNPRRTAATASALMTGLMLISAATVGVTSLSHMAERDAAREATSDLRVSAVDFAEMGDGTARRIGRLPDVATVRTVPGPRISKTEAGPPLAVLVDADPGRIQALDKRITRELDNPALVVRDRAELAAEAARPYEPFLNLAYALLSTSVLIGALGVVNTMAMSVRERVREIGLLRAVGLDRRATAAVVRLEAVLISLLGATLGVTSGAALGAVAVLGQDSATLTFPWTRLALFLGAAALLGVLAAALPARQASRIPVLRAVGTDGA
ncbi:MULTISPECIES: FtsX-like permease family protein [unclassified Streptomyces]|uniref:FtsX-like permease family protein n=1 Tax=unclassified Streptomyces TaxID=2593676 RepID=UPI002DD815A8|nr:MULTISPECIES: FtsX-like permease family protein [unclassified Streptomyces]WSA92761.1 ABC transporter permease [Streptomyces sp. NBC_01795]WSB77132.1 ABC transporter permease [Streptomyces sp. NBC_01775]WSS43417.1 ABC transporter permease [Streptomyces sp. NBC_01187]